MILSTPPEYISKDSFCKKYPDLYYGISGEWFVVKTPDDKICGLALSSFPHLVSLLRLFKRHRLIEKDIQMTKDPQYLTAGTPFQHRVWEALLKIPPGIVLSYQELANHLQIPKAVRAVANAVGANPISPLIPCHRMVGSHGHIGGYHWGVEAKVKLLKEEGVDFSIFKGLPI